MEGSAAENAADTDLPKVLVRTTFETDCIILDPLSENGADRTTEAADTVSDDVWESEQKRFKRESGESAPVTATAAAANDRFSVFSESFSTDEESDEADDEQVCDEDAIVMSRDDIQAHFNERFANDSESSDEDANVEQHDTATTSAQEGTSQGSGLRADDLDAESDEVCRVCRAESEPERPLFHPCLCKGSIKYVHQDCLMTWLRHSNSTRCEVCKYPFKFSPIYAEDCPPKLSYGELLRGLLGMLVGHIKTIGRFGLVFVAWLIIVPYCTSVISKLYFVKSLKGILLEIKEPWSFKESILDIIQGTVIWGVIILLSLALLLFRDFLRFNINALGEGFAALANDFGVNQNVALENIAQLAGDVEDDGEDDGEDDDDDDDEEVDMDGLAALNRDQLEQPNQPVQAENQPLIAEQPLGNANLPQAAQPQPPIDVPDLNAFVAGLDDPDAINLLDNQQDNIDFVELVGLRGEMFPFFENVLHVVVFNSLFLAFVALLPFNIGRLAIVVAGYDPKTVSAYLSVEGAPWVEEVSLIAVGYATFGLFSWGWIILSKILRNKLGIHVMTIPQSCLKFVIFLYSFLKVFILMSIELGLAPYAFGWVIDFYSIGFFGRSWASHEFHLKTDSFVYHFIHWFIGIIFLVYLAKIVSVIRSVVRPHVLWFLMNVEDPNFHPIRLMLNNNMAWHARRICVSFGIFSVSLLVILAVPIFVWSDIFPSIVPISIPEKSILSTVPFEACYHIAYIHYVLNRFHFATRIKSWTLQWFQAVGELLELSDYLVPSEDGNNPDPELSKPAHFRIRVAALLAFLAFTIMIIHSFLILVPLCVGHLFFGFVGVHFNNDLHILSHGAFVSFLICDIIRFSLDDIRQARVMELFSRLRTWVLKFFKSCFFMFVCMGVIPMLIGSAVYLYFVRPIYALHLQPFMYLLSYWVLGIVSINISFMVLSVGPDSFRAFLDEIYECINLNLPFKRTFKNVILPVLVVLLLLICLPYSLSKHISIYIAKGYYETVMVQRYTHPLALALATIIILQFYLPAFMRKIHDRIRDELYLRGRQLMNSIH